MQKVAPIKLFAMNSITSISLNKNYNKISCKDLLLE